jgi:HK97 family phage major capsid protein
MRNGLLALLAANRGAGQFRAESTGDGEATIWLYDVIVRDDYWGGVSALTLGKALADHRDKSLVHLRIDSPGGDVFAGRAMEQLISEHPGRVVAHIDGFAASAASYVALAAEERLISPGGMFMVHKAWTLAWGNEHDMRKVADLLGKIDETLIATYAARTGQTPEQLRDWIAAETWFNAEEALANGFATAIAGAPEAAAAPPADNASHWDLSAYARAPAIRAPAARLAPPAATATRPHSPSSTALRPCAASRSASSDALPRRRIEPPPGGFFTPSLWRIRNGTKHPSPAGANRRPRPRNQGPGRGQEHHLGRRAASAVRRRPRRDRRPQEPGRPHRAHHEPAGRRRPGQRPRRCRRPPRPRQRRHPGPSHPRPPALRDLDAPGRPRPLRRRLGRHPQHHEHQHASEGGYIVASEIAQAVADALKSFGGMRAVATVLQTSNGQEINFPNSDGTAEEGEIIAQNASVNDADITFGTTPIPVYKYSSKVVTVPIELLQDAVIDIEAFVNTRCTTRVGRITNKHFTIGTGTGQPKGIVTAATAGKIGPTGQTLTVTVDDLIDLEHAVDYGYRELGRCRWMMHDSSFKVVKKLKDTTGRPIFIPGYDGLGGKAPDTILGYPVSINNHMPVMAANAKSILFGDFTPYIIRDVLTATEFQRYTDSAYAKKGQVGFNLWARAGGNYTDVGGAVKYYANSAT